MTITPPIPARPQNGGRFEHRVNVARYSSDERWAFEPKVNGWRGIVHAHTGQMFNRLGAKLSIAGEFESAVRELVVLFRHRAEWIDVEALDRRHEWGRGTLIVLDVVPFDFETSDMNYRKRRELLARWVKPFSPYAPPTETDELWLIPSLDFADASRFWAAAPDLNTALGCTYYEGLVAKLNAPYQCGETPAWVKHRFTNQP